MAAGRGLGRSGGREWFDAGTSLNLRYPPPYSNEIEECVISGAFILVNCGHQADQVQAVIKAELEFQARKKRINPACKVHFKTSGDARVYVFVPPKHFASPPFKPILADTNVYLLP